MTALAQKTISIAVSQLGKSEVPLGSNYGGMVTEYLNAVGINFPASWCMSFVYWCVKQSCIATNLKNPLIKTGGVLHQWESVPHEHKSKTPIAGSIFIMDFGSGLGHTGFVEHLDSEFIYTIEGNSNSDGGRNGIAVVRHKRPINNKLIKGYITI